MFFSRFCLLEWFDRVSVVNHEWADLYHKQVLLSDEDALRVVVFSSLMNHPRRVAERADERTFCARRLFLSYSTNNEFFCSKTIRWPSWISKKIRRWHTVRIIYRTDGDQHEDKRRNRRSPGRLIESLSNVDLRGETNWSEKRKLFRTMSFTEFDWLWTPVEMQRSRSTINIRKSTSKQQHRESYSFIAFRMVSVRRWCGCRREFFLSLVIIGFLEEMRINPHWSRSRAASLTSLCVLIVERSSGRIPVARRLARRFRLFFGLSRRTAGWALFVSLIDVGTRRTGIGSVVPVRFVEIRVDWKRRVFIWLSLGRWKGDWRVK